MTQCKKLSLKTYRVSCPCWGPGARSSHSLRPDGTDHLPGTLSVAEGLGDTPFLSKALGSLPTLTLSLCPPSLFK